MMGERLKTELAGLNPADAAFATRIVELWNQRIAELPVLVIPSATNANVASGSLLPSEFPSWLAADLPPDQADRMLGSLAYLAIISRADVMLGLVKQRAGSLPPTSVDVAMFVAIDRAMAELSPARQYSPFEPWGELSNARNPIWRMLALRASLRTTSQAAASLSAEDKAYSQLDAPAKLAFYRKYLHEPDPLIRKEAARYAGFLPLPEGKEVLDAFDEIEMQQKR